MDPDPASGQQPRQPAGTRSVERIDEDIQVRGSERVEIDRPPDEPFVALVRVEPIHLPRCFGLGQRPALDVVPAIDRQSGLDHAQEVGSGRRAGGRLDLEAVIRPRVMAGRDDDPCGGPALDDFE
ncbi:MAG: hypothetical protein WKF78_04870 [Candidatus Limnocylindrales bacterium]